MYGTIRNLKACKEGQVLFDVNVLILIQGLHDNEPDIFLVPPLPSLRFIKLFAYCLKQTDVDPYPNNH